MSTRRWRRPPLIASPRLRWALLLGAAVYLVLAVATLQLDVTRMLAGLPRLGSLLEGFLAPDFRSRGGDILEGLLESFAITLISTALGFVLAVPVAAGAAHNLAPLPVYLACRTIITAGRSFPELILAIVFVAMLGFGPLAGVVTLTVASVGFMAKLIAEEIEALPPAPLQAIRTTGAAWPHWIHWSVLPQILPRMAGVVLYRLDINFRESAIIGIVGAGGIGATLNTAFGRYEYPVAAAVLLLIIVIVLATEYLSGWLRGWLR